MRYPRQSITIWWVTLLGRQLNQNHPKFSRVKIGCRSLLYHSSYCVNLSEKCWLSKVKVVFDLFQSAKFQKTSTGLLFYEWYRWKFYFFCCPIKQEKNFESQCLYRFHSDWSLYLKVNSMCFFTLPNKQLNFLLMISSEVCMGIWQKCLEKLVKLVLGYECEQSIATHKCLISLTSSVYCRWD